MSKSPDDDTERPRLWVRKFSSFEEERTGGGEGRFGESPVAYLGLEELIRAKEEAGRPQDLADLDWLREVQRTAAD